MQHHLPRVKIKLRFLYFSINLHWVVMCTLLWSKIDVWWSCCEENCFFVLILSFDRRMIFPYVSRMGWFYKQQQQAFIGWNERNSLGVGLQGVKQNSYRLFRWCLLYKSQTLCEGNLTPSQQQNAMVCLTISDLSAIYPVKEICKIKLLLCVICFRTIQKLQKLRTPTIWKRLEPCKWSI